ncbi:MAG TPA: AraC family transcriptional regulator [Allosphingosinicella sp.]|nr:AraC family transcriptional regulator [Allosphingosinicella sp.]
MIPQVRAATIATYVEVARFVGLDPYAMLSRAGISPAMLADPDNILPGQPVGLLLEDSARESGCEGFGLLMAESRSLASLGPLSLLLRHQGTAREVIEAIIRYQGLLTEVFAFSLEDDGDQAIIRVGFVAGFGRRQGIEYAMGLICRATSEVVGGRWHPDCAHFLHAAPEDLSIHRRLFQCPLLFDSDFSGFACAAAALDAPNPAAESAMARHAQRYLEMLIPDPADGTITERARRSLYLLLPAGRSTLDQVGRNLGLHPRALQRGLEKEGRSFGTLLNEVRRELALRYLSNQDHSVSAIAQMTGYASPSSFTRWFAGEFGLSPAAWRAEERAEPRAAAPARPALKV